MPTAGELRDRGTLERPVETPNAHGLPVSSWVAVAKRFECKVEQTGGSEPTTNTNQPQPQLAYRITARWLMEGILSKWRFVWHDGATDRVLEISGPPINPDGRRQWMILTAKQAT